MQKTGESLSLRRREGGQGQRWIWAPFSSYGVYNSELSFNKIFQRYYFHAVIPPVLWSSQESLSLIRYVFYLSDVIVHLPPL